MAKSEADKPFRFTLPLGIATNEEDKLSQQEYSDVFNELSNGLFRLERRFKYGYKIDFVHFDSAIQSNTGISIGFTVNNEEELDQFYESAKAVPKGSKELNRLSECLTSSTEHLGLHRKAKLGPSRTLVIKLVMTKKLYLKGQAFLCKEDDHEDDHVDDKSSKKATAPKGTDPRSDSQTSSKSTKVLDDKESSHAAKTKPVVATGKDRSDMPAGKLDKGNTPADGYGPGAAKPTDVRQATHTGGGKSSTNATTEIRSRSGSGARGSPSALMDYGTSSTHHGRDGSKNIPKETPSSLLRKERNDGSSSVIINITEPLVPDVKTKAAHYERQNVGADFPYSFDAEETRLKKTMIMAVPNFDNGTILDVCINSDSAYIPKTQMILHGNHLYRATFYLPSDHSEDIQYWYEWNSKTRAYVVSSRITAVQSQHFRVTKSDVIRNFWSTASYMDLPAVAEHVVDIVKLCTHHEHTNEACMQLEHLLKLYVTFLNAETIIKNVLKQIDLRSSAACLVVAMAIGLLVKQGDSIRRLTCLDKDVASMIMAGLQSYRLSELPQSCSEYIPKVCQCLCLLALKDSYCCVTYLDMCYPFYPERLLNHILDSYITKKWGMHTTSDDTLVRSRALDFCCRLGKQLSMNTSKETESVLSRYLRNCPLPAAVAFCHKWETIAISDGSCADKEKVLEVITSSVRSLILPLLSEARKTNRLQTILELWETLGSALYLQTTFKHQCANAVTEILQKCSVQKSDNVKDILMKFCTSHMFDDQQNQIKLMDALANSPVANIHGCFIPLAHIPIMSEIMSIVEEKTVVAWFDQTIIFRARARSYGKESAILSLYKHFDELVSIESIAKRPSVVHRLREIIANELTRHELKEVLRMSDDVEDAHFTHPDVKQLYRDQAKALLEKKCSTQDPYDMLSSMCTTYGQLRVNSSVTGDLVTSILDVACSVPEDIDDSERFVLLVGKYKLWKMVLDVTGKKAEVVKCNKQVKKALECIQTTVNLFQTSSVRYGLIKQLEKNSEAAIDLLAYGKPSRREIKQWWGDAKSVYERERGKMQCIIEVMEKVQSKINKAFLPTGFTELLHDIKHMANSIVKGSITAKQCQMKEGIWSVLHDLYDTCQFFKSVVSSGVFWNVCREPIEAKVFLTTNDEDIEVGSEVEAQSDRQHYESCLAFLKTLQDRGQNLYRDSWLELQNNVDLEMSKVSAMIVATDINVEIKLAEKYLRCKLKKWVRETLERLNSIEFFKKTVDAMQMSLESFGISDEQIQRAVTSFVSLCKSGSTDLTFHAVSCSFETVFNESKDLSDDTISILHALGKSSSLIEFLREIVDEDIRNLIDAVEDISEQYVRETTVSGLIEVKRFLQPLLTPDPELTAHKLFSFTENQMQFFGKVAETLPLRIEDCMENLHNLKSLYNNVANRGEQTKEIIKFVVSEGFFDFELDPDTHQCIFKAKYEIGGNKTSHSSATLVDLRSRALLLMNAEKTGTEDASSADNLLEFVHFVDTCLDIAETVQVLFASGNVRYNHYKKSESHTNLVALKEALSLQLSLWKTSLLEETKSHYLMNFLQGVQIHTLYAYLENDTQRRDVASILKFMHPDMDVDMLRKEYLCEKKRQETFTDGEMLHCMGHAVHSTYGDLSAPQRCFASKDVKGKRITETVRIGKLLVADLEENSLSVVKTVLALYANTSTKYLEANQILFCSQDTSWDELQMLLNRCLGAYEFYGFHMLFCIANVEMLPNEIQFKLVEALRGLEGKEHFMLAVVCRGSSSHPFKDELSQYVMNVRPASDQTVREIFQNECPNVRTITSDVAGLGKSTKVHTMAHRNSKGVVTLHVSGPVRKGRLIEQLCDLHIESHHVLHLDIGRVDNPVELDTFLFELIILRYVTTGTASFSLPTSHVSIEIGNTINNSLRNSLQAGVSFTREHIEWKNYSDFVVSREIHSAVQVVCHFLSGIENNSIDKSDICFSGDSAVKPLSSQLCKKLLRRYIGSAGDMSFTVVNIFLQVLSDQLKKMSCSTFFKTSRIVDMVGHKTVPTVRSTLVLALVEVSKEFSTRSVAACRATQSSTVGAPSSTGDTDSKTTTGVVDLASSATKRISSMIRWEDSNHLIYVFHNQNIQTISPMYREKSKVPSNIRTLFEGQMKKELQEYRTMTQLELQTLLQKVARTSPLPLPSKQLQDLARDYALTPDNLLKMVLIMLRIKANIPVIVMGETGCGKTSLVRYLAAICEVPFNVFNIHAGVEEQAIIDKVFECHDKALLNLGVEQWLFLDEINTCEYLGLMADVVCHHRCLGQTLAPNLVVMCACNPYKLRTSAAISTAGLQGKVKTDELSRLVYRVLPLPEMMVDYVWDFGSLSEKDECIYIMQMVKDVFPDSQKHHTLFSELLAKSQQFVRNEEKADCSVSLRDVQRCRILTKWFLQVLDRKKLKRRTSVECDTPVKAIILALAHCYHSRFADKSIRKRYRQMLQATFQTNNRNIFNEDYIHDIIKIEQRDILERMDLPEGTAKNTPLQENVFVILVCILNRIPIFVVGKPGCSKSLAMQVIRSNLRGKDSKDDFFKTLPQLYCVSFQGSESSTSDGILKVFEKAENYQESNNKDDVLSVVILDEIGLAEVSRFNPLKVLHNLLEPDGQSCPNVAVVGISNWSLDASKMNRAIHLSRPDMDVEELTETGISISNSFVKEPTDILHSLHFRTLFSTNEIKTELRGIATAYFAYTHKLRFENFHGLRDYYSLVKYIAGTFSRDDKVLYTDEKMEVIFTGIERNFGGLQAERSTLYKEFREALRFDGTVDIPVVELIKDNIRDELARHLMLITTGESVLGIIEQKLKEVGREKKEIIVGSQFEEDLTDDYNYRILSRIILCMEQGIVLILKDLENVYGSLYDMLNQNYTVVGKKKNCRVALGPYSNPMCHVHDSFRCIVLVDESSIDYADPPFLNRFEKQYLRFCDIINKEQAAVIKEITHWIHGLTAIKGKHFKEEDAFPIYSEDLIASLLLRFDKEFSDMDKEDVISRCQAELLWIIKPDAILRLHKSDDDSILSEADVIQGKYFNLPVHKGIGSLIEYQFKEIITQQNVKMMEEEEEEMAMDDEELEEKAKMVIEGEEKNAGMKINEEEKIKNAKMGCLMTIVFTNSNIHSKISVNLEDQQVQIDKLGAFKSEKQLSLRMQKFWLESDCSILFLQCSAVDDEKHIMLAKSVVERYRSEFLADFTSTSTPKHVYLIVHLDRSKGKSKSILQINFLTDWKLVMLDNLECPITPLPKLCNSLLTDIILRRPMEHHIKEQLFWAFTRIKYGSAGREVQSITRVTEAINNSPEFLAILNEQICFWIKENKRNIHDVDWQINVACDKQALQTSSSFVDALERHILNVINLPLSKTIYQMENFGIIDCFFYADGKSHARGNTWRNLLNDVRIFSICDVPNETGPECYQCATVDLALKMPFSQYIFECTEATREEFVESLTILKGKCELEDNEDLPTEVFDELLLKQEHFILQNLPDMTAFTYDNWEDDYIHDFCNIVSHSTCSSLPKQKRIEYMHWAISEKTNLSLGDPSKLLMHLHTTFWTHVDLFSSEMQLLELCRDVIFDEKYDILLKMKENDSAERSSVNEQSDIVSDTEMHHSSESLESDTLLVKQTVGVKIEHSISKDEKTSDADVRESLTQPVQFDGNSDADETGPMIEKHTCMLEVSDGARMAGENLSNVIVDDKSAVAYEGDGSEKQPHEMSSKREAGYDSETNVEDLCSAVSEAQTAGTTSNAIENAEKSPEDGLCSVIVGDTIENVVENELKTEKVVAPNVEKIKSSLPNLSTVEQSGNISDNEDNFDLNSKDSSFEERIENVSDLSQEECDGHSRLELNEDIPNRSISSGLVSEYQTDSELDDSTEVPSTFEQQDDLNGEVTIEDTGQESACFAGNEIKENPVEEEEQSHIFTSHDLLVDMICKRMLPTHKTIQKYKGIQTWQMKINSLLALAARVSRNPESLHALRFCNDLVSAFHPQYSHIDGHLQTIGNMLWKGENLDSEPIFQAVKAIVMTSPPSVRPMCQKVLVTYFIRCLTSNASSQAVTYLLHMITASELPDGLTYVKIPIQLVLKYELDEDEEAYFNLIDEGIDIIKENACFLAIHTFLTEMESRKQLDSPCVSLLMDALEDIYTDILEQVEQVNSIDEESEELEEQPQAEIERMSDMFLKSHSVLINDSSGLQRLASLAFFKAYVQIALNSVEEINKDTFSAVFASKGTALQDSLLQYIYKVLAVGKCHGHIMKVCADFLKSLHCSKDVKWNAQYAMVSFDTCPMVVYSPGVVKDFVMLFNKPLDEIDLDKNIADLAEKAVCPDNAHGMMTLYSFAMQRFYLPRSFCGIDDTMNASAQRVLRIALDGHMTGQRVKLLKCLLGQEDFHGQNLMLEETSEPAEFVISSFLISLYCVMLSYYPNTVHDQSPVLVTCLLKASSRSLFLPAFPEETSKVCTTLSTPKVVKCYYFNCSCGHRIVLSKSCESNECIVCGKLLESENVLDLDENGDIVVERGYIISEEVFTPGFAVRSLSPVACQMLPILIKGCLLGSAAMGFVPLEQLEAQTGLPEVDGLQSLWADIQNHWKNIEQLMNMDTYNVGLLLHAILFHAREFLLEDGPILSTPSDRLKWEEKFTSIIAPILNDRCQVVKSMVTEHNRILGISSEITEHSLHEFTDIENMSNEARQTGLPSLLRLKGTPSRENFLSELHKHQQAVPFLVLTLQHELDLQLPKHIISIVRWHIAATANASYLMRKQDCLKMTVNDFVCRSKDEEKIDLLKKRFAEFEHSWEALKDHPCVKSLDLDIGHVRFHTSVAECLILSDESKVFKMLQFLVEKQNTFLDRTLELAHVCSSVRFLRREEDITILPCIQICESKPMHLIDFEWQDTYLQYSQCDLEYGQGTRVAYDFQTIERALALEIIVGKSYINLNTGLPKIVFTDELYKNYTSLVKELKTKVKQSSLPADLSAGVRHKSEYNPNMTTELLTHLGIIMTLLNKTAGDPNKPLVDYVEEWKNILTHSLPSELLPKPENGVKLTHLVSLHELLEELNSKSIVATLEGDFLADLDMGTDNHFKALAKNHHSTLIMVLRTMKIFIHRCLSFRDAAPCQPLLQYLSDESFWPDGVLVDDGVKVAETVSPLSKLIPEGFLVGHVCSAVKLIEREIEAQKQREMKMSDIASVFNKQTKSSAVTKATKKKRTAKMGNF